jgi:hypothetical protein
MLYELEEELHPILAKNSKKKVPHGAVVEGLSIIGIYTGSADQGSRTRRGIVLWCNELKILQNVDESDQFVLSQAGSSRFEIPHPSILGVPYR